MKGGWQVGGEMGGGSGGGRQIKALVLDSDLQTASWAVEQKLMGE